MKSLFKKIIVSFLILMIIPVPVKGEEYKYIGDSTEEYVLKDRTMKIPYITVDGLQAYCAEYDKEVPNNIKYRKFNGGKEYDSRGVLAILYNGYPANISGLKEKYSLSNEEALMYTQYALWNYIQGWDRNKIDNAYAKELLKKADNKEFENREFKIDESKLIFKKKDDNFETELISTSGIKGKFVIKTSNGTKIYDENGHERYNFEVGESFIIRNVSLKNAESKIIIDSEYDFLSMDVYEPEDSQYQDLILTSTNVMENSREYVVKADLTTNRNVVQTLDSDNEIIYLFIITLGCGIYILLNLDFKKRYK